MTYNQAREKWFDHLAENGWAIHQKTPDGTYLKFPYAYREGYLRIYFKRQAIYYGSDLKTARSLMSDMRELCFLALTQWIESNKGLTHGL